ncbi:MAG: CvpA family protein [Myxococcaceae bacterium]
MNLDLIILALALVFAVFGAFSGAARQLAAWVAIVAAYIGGPFLGKLGAPAMAKALSVPNNLAVIAASLVAFILVYVITRQVVTSLVSRVLGDQQGEKSGVNRFLGFVLGGLKVIAIAWAMLSALTFVERRFQDVTKSWGFLPRESKAWTLAKRYNVFDLGQFQQVTAFMTLAEKLRHPETAAKLAQDPAFRAVSNDPRFQAALRTSEVQRAVEAGDTSALFRSEALMQLLKDPEFLRRLTAATQTAVVNEATAPKP